MPKFPLALVALSACAGPPPRIPLDSAFPSDASVLGDAGGDSDLDALPDAFPDTGDGGVQDALTVDAEDDGGCGVMAAAGTMVGLGNFADTRFAFRAGLDDGSVTMTRLVVVTFPSGAPAAAETFVTSENPVAGAWTVSYQPALGGQIGITISDFFVGTSSLFVLLSNMTTLPLTTPFSFVLAVSYDSGGPPGDQLRVAASGLAASSTGALAINPDSLGATTLLGRAFGVGSPATGSFISEYMSSDTTALTTAQLDALVAQAEADLAAGNTITTFAGAQHYFTARDIRCLNFDWIDRITGVDFFQGAGSVATSEFPAVFP